MYREDHVYQTDVAKYYKVSPSLVSKLVKEAKEEKEKNDELIRLEEERKAQKEAIRSVVNEMFEHQQPIKCAY